MKLCEQYAPLLDSFVDGELSEQEAATVREHLAACPACAAYVSDVFAIRAAFGDVEETEVPDGFADGVMAVIRANAAPRKKPHRALKTAASLAACAVLAFTAVRVLPFRERFPDNAPMVSIAGGGTASTAQSKSSAENSQESGAAAEKNASYDASSAKDALPRSYTGSSSQTTEMYGAPSPDSAKPSEQQSPPSFFMAQANEDGGAPTEGTVFAGVVFLPAGERLSELLDGREGQAYTDADGGSGTGYAMTQEELTDILEKLGAEPALRLNADKTTELYCLVVSDS